MTLKLSFLPIICMIFLIGTVSADIFEFDNKKYYDEETQTMTFKNSLLGLPLDTIATTQLMTEKSRIINNKYQSLATFKFNNYEVYPNFIKEIESFKEVDGGEVLDYNYIWKYFNKDVGTHKEYFTEELNYPNGTKYNITTSKEVTGSLVIFDELADLPIGETIIEIFFNPNQSIPSNQIIEIIPTFFGVRAEEFFDTEIRQNYVSGEDAHRPVFNTGANSQAQCFTPQGDPYEIFNHEIRVSSAGSEGTFYGGYYFATDNSSGTEPDYSVAGEIAKFVNISDGTIGASKEWYNLSFQNNNVTTWDNVTICAVYRATGTDDNWYLLANDNSAATYSFGSGWQFNAGSWALTSPVPGDYLFKTHAIIPPNDSPIVTLNNPLNNTNFTVSTIETAGTISDAEGLVNVSLYLDGVINQTNSSGFNATQYNFSVTLADGTYDWYYDAWDDRSPPQQTLGTARRFSIDTINPSVIINYPTNITRTIEYATSSTFNININATETDTNLDTCWIEFTNSTNQSITCNVNKTLTGTTFAIHTWRIWANDSFGRTGHADITATWDFNNLQNALFFNSTSFETAKESHVLNITTNGTAPTSIILSHNGTNYSANAISIAGNNYNLSATIIMPLVSGNKTWSYYFRVGGGTIQSTTNQQNVSQTHFGVCNATLSTGYSNYTFADEGNESAQIGNIPSSTWTYYLENTSVTKTFTFANTTDHGVFSFCGIPSARAITTNYSLQYQGVNYPQRIYEATETFNSTTLSRILYFLKTSDGIFVTFQVINVAQQTIANVDANTTRSIGGSDVLVGIGTTGADGGITYWLNPNFLHTFGFTKAGFATLVTSLFPTQTTYTITLGSTASTSINDYTRGVNFTIFPRGSTALVNDTEQTFNFSLTSTFWTVEEFGFNLRNSTGNLFNSTTLSANGGTVQVILNTGNNTNLVMDYFWVINSTSTNATITWIVFNSAGTGWGLATFFTDLNSYISLGLFGLDNFGLGIIGFLIIFLFSGVLSFKFGLTSPAAIMGVIFSITFFLDVGVGLFDNINPIGAVPFFPTIFIAVIFIGIMIKEGTK